MSELKNVVMTGYLWKWTNYMNGYQKRWFSLENLVISYYRSSEEVNKPSRGSINLSEAFIETIDTYTFSVVNKSGIAFHIKCSTEIERQRWVTALEISKAQYFSSKLNLEENYKVSQLLTKLEDKLDDLNLNLKFANELFLSHQPTNKIIQPDLDICFKSFNNFSKSAEDFCVIANLLVKKFNIKDSTHSVEANRGFNIALEKQKDNISIDSNQLEMKETDIDDEFQDAISDNETVSIDPPPPVSTMATSFESKDSKNKLSCSKYRNRINPKPDIRMSLWGVIKNCIGKDLSKIPMPVNFNEPLSMLQRVTESLEYSNLLDKAAECQDSLIQLCYVAAFSVASYANTSVRTGKPFNPLLGETYELDRSVDLGVRCICEQVSHHPPISASHATGKDWSLFETFCASSKFRGKYLTVNPTGSSHIQFNNSSNHYTWNKVTTTVHNIIVGKLWIDQSGTSTITNHFTGDKCILKFSAYSYLSSEQPRKVVGNVMDKNGNVKFCIQGYWDQQLSYYSFNKNKPNIPSDCLTLWTCNPLDTDAEKMYYFSPFACSLNQIDDTVAPTDSRFRPDQRKMEEGFFDDANDIKLKLEENQRERRKRNSNHSHEPMWFKLDKEPYSNEPDKTMFIYSGDYWERKRDNNWSNIPSIFKY